MEGKEEKDQIEEMLAGHSEEPEVEEPEIEEEEQEEEEPEVEEEPEEEEEPEVDEDDDGEEEDPEPEEEEEPDEDDDEDQVAALQNQLNEMSKKLRDAGMSIETSAPAKDSDDEEEGKEKKQEVLQFMTEEELDELQDNPGKMNEILNRVYARAQEDIMKSIPSVVQKTTSRQITLQNKVKDFYEENKDLLAHRDFVSFVASEIEGQNPDKDLDWIFDQTAKQARKRLGIRKSAEDTESNRRRGSKNKPAFASKPRGGRGGKQDTRNKQQKQIDQILDR